VRHLFLKLKVMRWKGDHKESEFQPNATGIEKEPKSLKCEENGITFKTGILQKNFPTENKKQKNKKRNVKLLQTHEENCNNEHIVSVAHKNVVGPHRIPHTSLYSSWRLTIRFW